MQLQHNATILLVSSDAARRQKLKHILDETQHTIISTHSLGTGILQLEQDAPTLIVVDAEPDGSDGYLLCENARHSFSAPTGLLAIIPREEIAPVRALAAGADDYAYFDSAPLLLRQRVTLLVQVWQARNHNIGISANGEDKYKQLFTHANDAIFVVDLMSGQFLDVNRKASKWLGYSRDELLNMHYDDLEAQMGDSPSVESAVQELTTNGHFIFEQGYKTKANTIVPAEVSSRVFMYNGRRAIMNFARDISKRKQLQTEEWRQRKLAQALRDTAAALNHTLKLDEVIEHVMDYLLRVIPGDTVSLMLISEDASNQAWIHGHRGYDAEDMALRGHWHTNHWDINTTASLKWMCDHRQPLVIPNVATFDGWVHDDRIKISSYVGAPIIVDNQVIGFINLDSSQPYHLNETHGDHLMAFANQAGIAIQNARFHEDIQQYADQLETRVEERTRQLTEANTQLKEQIIERQRAEEALTEERNVLRTLIDNLPDEIYVKDLDGHMILVNKTLGQRLQQQYGLDTGIGLTDYDFLSRERADHHRHREQQIIASGIPVINEEITRQNGEAQQIVLITQAPLYDNLGQVSSIVGINRDVTALRQATAQLQEERNLLRALIDNIPDEIYVKNLNGQIILANRALINRVGGRVNDVIGSRDFDYFDINDDTGQALAQKLYDQEQHLLHDGDGIINEIVRINDEQVGIRWLATTKVPIRDSQGKITGLVGVNRDMTEEKRNEERITHIISSAYCLLWYAIVDIDGEDTPAWDIHASSEEAAQHFMPLELHAEQTYVEAMHQNIPAADLAMMYQTSETALRQGHSNYSQEFRCIRADGETRWLHEEVQIKPLTSGRFNLVGVCTDITDSKQTEEVLQQRVKERTAELINTNRDLTEQIGERKRAEVAEREQRILAEALSAAAATLTQSLELNQVIDHILTYAGRVVPPHQTAAINLIEDDDYVRTTRFRIYTEYGIKTTEITERYRLDALPLLQQVHQTGLPIITHDIQQEENWVVMKHIEHIRSHISVPIYANGNIIGFINLGSENARQFTQDHARKLMAFSHQAGIAIQNARLFERLSAYTDELELRVAERTNQLESERAQLHAILNAMTEGVIYQDDAGTVRYINQSLEKLTGFAADAWQAEASPALIHVFPDGALLSEKQMEQVQRKGVLQSERRLRDYDENEFDARMVTTLVPGTDGQQAGVVMVLRDVSAEKRLEAQKARFIATASHELRTPITNMKTRLYLIKRQPEKMSTHLVVMNSVTERMQKLVEDLLDASRFEHGTIPLSIETLPMQSITHTVIDVQQPEAEKKQITLTHIAPDTPLMVNIDPARMEQVVTNLVTNAINYTPEGGTVTAEVLEELNAGADTHAPHGWALLRVHDTGIGIPENMLSEVFKPFFRVSEYNAGTGLGLSITRDIIERHGGEIIVDSVVNEGTTFTVRLPLAQPFTPDSA